MNRYFEVFENDYSQQFKFFYIKSIYFKDHLWESLNSRHNRVDLFIRLYINGLEVDHKTYVISNLWYSGSPVKN